LVSARDEIDELGLSCEDDHESVYELLRLMDGVDDNRARDDF
jgi:hypothetical protein